MPCDKESDKMKTKDMRGGQLHAIMAIFLLIIFTSLCFIPIFIIGLFKLIPIKPWRAFCTRMVDAVAMFWTGVNNTYLKCIPVKWDITAPDNLQKKDWYLVVANHQSWLDIVILQSLFNRKIPVLKFFIKDQLKWIPFLGFAWWVMGCPFMKRYSKDYLAKKPHKQGKDIAATYKAIEKFKQQPATIMNFIEGTRYTALKHQQQNSPYKHLLKPKAGGIGFVLSTMGQQIHSLLDVTIVYPDKKHSLWDFLCRRLNTIKVHIRHVPIPIAFKNAELAHDQTIQSEFREWLNQQWAEKDQLITSLKA